MQWKLSFFKFPLAFKLLILPPPSSHPLEWYYKQSTLISLWLRIWQVHSGLWLVTLNIDLLLSQITGWSHIGENEDEMFRIGKRVPHTYRIIRCVPARHGRSMYQLFEISKYSYETSLHQNLSIHWTKIWWPWPWLLT